MPAGVQRKFGPQVRKPATENPSAALANLVTWDTNPWIKSFCCVANAGETTSPNCSRLAKSSSLHNGTRKWV